MTQIFADGFESGNFSAWTGITGTPSVVNTDKHHGIYSAYFVGTSGKCYKYITPQMLCHTRGYFRFADLTQLGDWNVLYFLSFTTNDWTDIVHASISKHPDGTFGWVLFGRNGTNFEYVESSAFTLNPSKWYSVELVMYVHETTGYYYLYIDGTLVCSLVGKNSSVYGNIWVVHTGNWWSSAPCEIYWDCVVVADAYVGSEEAYFTLTYQSNPIVVPCDINGQALTSGESIQVPSGTSVTVSVPSEVTA